MDLMDIYDDLDEFHEKEEKKSKELLALEAKHNEALNTIEAMKLEKKDLRKKIRIMEQNLQSLLDTAKAEIRRKDRIIEDLRREKDDICFRRRKVHGSSGTETNFVGHSNQNTHTISQNVIKEDQFQQADILQDCVKRNPFKQELLGDGAEVSHTDLRMCKNTNNARDCYRSNSKDRPNRHRERSSSKEHQSNKLERNFKKDNESCHSKRRNDSDKDSQYNRHTNERDFSKSRRSHRSRSKERTDDANFYKQSSHSDNANFDRRKFESKFGRYNHKDERNKSNKYTENCKHDSRSRERDRERGKYEQKHSGINDDRSYHHSSRRDNELTRSYERNEKYVSKNDKSNLKNENNNRESSAENVRKKSHSSESLKEGSQNRKRRRSTDSRDYDDSRHKSKNKKEECEQYERLHDVAEKLRLELKNIAGSEAESGAKAKNVMTVYDEIKKMPVVQSTENRPDNTDEPNDSPNRQVSELTPATQLDNFQGMPLNDQVYSSTATIIDKNNDDKIIEEIHTDKNLNSSKTHKMLDTQFSVSPKQRKQEGSTSELLANAKEILETSVVNSTTPSDTYTDASEASIKTLNNGSTISTTTSTVAENKDSLLQEKDIASSDSWADCLPMQVINISDQVCNSPSSIISISSSVTMQFKIGDSPEKLKEVNDDKIVENPNSTLDTDKVTNRLNNHKSKEDCLAESAEGLQNFELNEQKSCKVAVIKNLNHIAMETSIIATTRFEDNALLNETKKSKDFDLIVKNDNIMDLDKAAITTEVITKTNNASSDLVEKSDFMNGTLAIVERNTVSDAIKSETLSNNNVAELGDSTTTDTEGKVTKMQHLAVLIDDSNKAGLPNVEKAATLEHDVQTFNNTTIAPCFDKLAKATNCNEDITAVTTTNINDIVDGNKAESNLPKNVTECDNNETAKLNNVTIPLISETTFSFKQNLKQQNFKNIEQIVKASKKSIVKANEAAGPLKDADTIDLGFKSVDGSKVASKKIAAVKANNKKCKRIVSDKKVKTKKVPARNAGNLSVKETEPLNFQISSDESSSDLIPLAQLQRKQKIEIIENIRLPTLLNESKMEFQPKDNLDTKRVEDNESNTFPKNTKPKITDKIDLIKPYSSVETSYSFTKSISNKKSEGYCNNNIVAETTTPEVELRPTPLNEVETIPVRSNINNNQTNIIESQITPNEILHEGYDENFCAMTTVQALQQLHDLNELTSDNIKASLKKQQISHKTIGNNTKPKSPQKSYIKLDMAKASKNKERKSSLQTTEPGAITLKIKRQPPMRRSTQVQSKTTIITTLDTPNQTTTTLENPTAEQIDLEKVKPNTSDDFKEILTTETSPLSMPGNQMAFNDAKFVDIDRSMQAMFQSPNKIEPETSINECNNTIDETVALADTSEQRELELAVSSILPADSSCCCNINTNCECKNFSLDNSFESKRLSLGTSEYLVERVSENVVTMFITRKKRKKSKTTVSKTDTVK